MKIVYGDPPNIDAIQRTFGLIRADAFFCYGDVMYTRQRRDGVDLGVVRHETIHSEQQRRAGGPDKWWERYLADPMFRREQEVEAYRAQIAFYRLKLGSTPGGRKLMRKIVLAISKEMAGPMYGRMVTRQGAVELLTVGPSSLATPRTPRVKLEIPPEWDASTEVGASEPTEPARPRSGLLGSRAIRWLRERTRRTRGSAAAASRS